MKSYATQECIRYGRGLVCAKPFSSTGSTTGKVNRNDRLYSALAFKGGFTIDRKMVYVIVLLIGQPLVWLLHLLGG